VHLLSETITPATGPAPAFPKVYPELDPTVLGDPRAFVNGHPFATYKRLRDQAPVAWQTELDPREPGFWAITRFEDVARVNTDPETFSSQRGGILMSAGPPETRHPLLFRASMDTMINMDAPWHLQLRREHMPFFTPRYLAELRERIAGETTRLLDNVEASGGECDLVEVVSSRLPLFTLCEILGVPEADRPKFLSWMHYLELAQSLAADRSKITEPTIELMQFIQAFNDNVAEMFEYGLHMLKKRREDPQPDMMTAIARAQVDGQYLRDEYLDGSWLLIVFAGNDTTRNTISGAMKLLTEFPEEKQKLIADPGLLPNAVDEFIRMVSPVIYMRRTATRDVEVNGQRIAEGEKVVMWYGAANRDQRMFDDPDTLKVDRANASKHLAFGQGPHVCLGKRVAQLQLEEAYRQLLARFPDMEYAGGIDIAPGNFVHAIRKLPVRFTPGKRAA
jgi:cytochrome P450